NWSDPVATLTTISSPRTGHGVGFGVGTGVCADAETVRIPAAIARRGAFMGTSRVSRNRWRDPTPSVQELLAVPDVVREEELGEVVGRGVVGAAAVDLGQLVHEFDKVSIRRDHEGGDRDAVAPAGIGLLERAVDDLQIQPERVLVEPSAFPDRRGLAVGDEEDLLVRILAVDEQFARE